MPHIELVKFCQNPGPSDSASATLGERQTRYTIVYEGKTRDYRAVSDRFSTVVTWSSEKEKGEEGGADRERERMSWCR